MTYSATDICLIIETAHRSKVGYLEIGPIKVVLNGADTPLKTPWLQQTPVPDKLFEKEIEAAKEGTLSTDEASLRTEQVEDLILTDPLEYERRILRGDLIDEGPSEHG